MLFAIDKLLQLFFILNMLNEHENVKVTAAFFARQYNVVGCTLSVIIPTAQMWPTKCTSTMLVGCTKINDSKHTKLVKPVFADIDGFVMLMSSSDAQSS